MAKFDLPAIIHDWPTRAYIRQLGNIRYVGIALKVCRRIHLRVRLAEAQNWKCCWCGCECVAESNYQNSATIEHVVPRSLGGSDDWENLAMACNKCNHRRGIKSVDDMLEITASVDKSETDASDSKFKDRHEKKRYKSALKKAASLNENGWTCSNGGSLSKEFWLSTLKLKEELLADVRAIVYADAQQSSETECVLT